MKAQGMTWVDYVSEFQGTWSLRTRAVGQETCTSTSSKLSTHISISPPTDLLPTHLPIQLPTYVATSICLSYLTDLCNSDPGIWRSADDAPSRNRCGNNFKIARAVPVSSHELWYMEFGSIRGMTARTKIRTSRRNTPHSHFTKRTTNGRLRRRSTASRAIKAWSPTTHSTT